MSNAALLVTGASGHLGRRVIELLLERGAGPIIAATRRPELLQHFATRGVDVRRASFDDEPATLAAAFQGARRALLISTDDVATGTRFALQEAAVRAFAKAGVETVAYTSITNAPASTVTFAPDHSGTEAAITKAGLNLVALRNNIYTDMLLFSLPAALGSGTIVDARGSGRLGWVTREDCARVAAAVLVAADAQSHIYEVTGPEALSSNDIAILASEIFGRPVEHVSMPIDAVVAGMIEHGMPEVLARAYASIDGAVANGELDVVTDCVQTLTGQAPQSVREFLLANREALLM